MHSSRGDGPCTRPAADEGGDLYVALERFALDRSTTAAHDESDLSSSEMLHSASQYEPGYHAAERFSQLLDSQQKRWISNHPPPPTAAEALRQRWGLSGSFADPSRRTPTPRQLQTGEQEDTYQLPPSKWGFSQALEQLRGDIAKLQRMPTAEEVLMQLQQQQRTDRLASGQAASHSSSLCGATAPEQREEPGCGSSASADKSLRGGADASYLATLEELQVRDFFQKLLSLEREGALLHESDAEAHYIPTSVIKFRLRRARYLQHNFSSVSMPQRISRAHRPFPTPAAPRPAAEL